MRLIVALFAGALVATASPPAAAQVPVVANPDHERMLASTDAKLAANKRLVYDFWREVLEAGHLDKAEQYLSEGYAQHNPNVPTGRAGFVEFFGKFSKRRPMEPRVQAPLVAMVAEGDLVVMAFARQVTDPKDASRPYTTTWFDMFRVEGGRIVAHWDPATRQ